MVTRTPTARTACPYCGQLVLPHQARNTCPHCDRQLFQVRCPVCEAPTLNLTLLPRYGVLTCFRCHHEFSTLPGCPETAPAASQRMFTAQVPRLPSLPSAAEARRMLEPCLAGFVCAAAVLTGELADIAARYHQRISTLLRLDDAMEGGRVTACWLRQEAPHLTWVAARCYQPLWPEAGMLLPEGIQAWGLAVDAVARQWQAARRAWLQAQCGLAVLPIVPGSTVYDPAVHDADGEGTRIVAVRAPGFLLQDILLRRARVRVGEESLSPGL